MDMSICMDRGLARYGVSWRHTVSKLGLAFWTTDGLANACRAEQSRQFYLFWGVKKGTFHYRFKGNEKDPNLGDTVGHYDFDSREGTAGMLYMRKEAYFGITSPGYKEEKNER